MLPRELLLAGFEHQMIDRFRVRRTESMNYRLVVVAS